MIVLLPSRIVQGATLLCLAAISLTLWIALSQPWLGIALKSGGETQPVAIISTHPSGPARALPLPARLVAVGNSGAAGPVEIEADDVIEEPDMFETYEQTGRFMQRQTTLAALLRQPKVALTVATESGQTQSVDLAPARRPLADLPLAFWIQLFTGAGALLIGAYVLAMRPADIATRLFALSGAMITVSAFAAAIYSSRELAIDGELFRVLSAFNHIGALGFGMAMIALFLIYPRRLMSPRLLWIVPAVFVPWLAADILRLAPSQPVGSQLPTLIEMLLIVVMVGVQWLVNGNDPRARAALNWLGLSVIVGAGAFVSLTIAPVLVQMEPVIDQGHAFGFFLLIYAGLALGVGRYRLFDLSEWAFRITFYTGATLLLFAIDAALIVFLQFQPASALGIALLLVGFGYLPLRSLLWNRFVARRGLPEHELFRAIIDVSLAVTAAERSERWRQLLQRLFDPLVMEETQEAVAAVEVREEGLEVRLPPAAATPALVLRYPWRGRRLFGSAHQDLARELVRLMLYTEESRTAYERGSIEERQRIARDLHDDVGARLLSGLYKTDLGETHRVLRDAITDIRTIVSGLSTDQPPLGRMIAALRHETGERLAAAGVELDWPLDPQDDSPLPLDYPAYRCFSAAHREIVSNIIRHAGARRVSIRVGIRADHDGERLTTTIADDGIGIDAAHLEGRPTGNGLRGLLRRVRDANGHVAIRRLPAGTAVEITIPLRAATAAAPQASAPDPHPAFEGCVEAGATPRVRTT